MLLKQRENTTEKKIEIILLNSLITLLVDILDIDVGSTGIETIIINNIKPWGNCVTTYIFYIPVISDSSPIPIIFSAVTFTIYCLPLETLVNVICVMLLVTLCTRDPSDE